MMNSRNCNRGGLHLGTCADQLLDGTECLAAKFFRHGFGTCKILVNHADKPNISGFLSELVIDARVVASEGAYPNDGDGNGSV